MNIQAFLNHGKKIPRTLTIWLFHINGGKTSMTRSLTSLSKGHSNTIMISRLRHPELSKQGLFCVRHEAGDCPMFNTALTDPGLKDRLFRLLEIAPLFIIK